MNHILEQEVALIAQHIAKTRAVQAARLGVTSLVVQAVTLHAKALV